jgi:type I restriction enzyme S subunit
MNKIEKLIEELCPEGVPFLRVGDVAKVGTGSSNRDEMNVGGIYPLYVRSKNILTSDTFEFDEESIVIPGEGGVGEVFHYVNGKYALHQRAYRIAFHDSRISTKYSYYIFQALFNAFILQKAVSATVTSIRKPMIENFLIPTPPIAVQQEIVSILDKFTELEAELKAELDARKIQSVQFSESLFVFKTGETKRFRIRDICEISRGTVISKDYLRDHPGEYPVYSSQTLNNGIFGYIDTFAYNFESLTWTTDGANAGSIFYHKNESFTITNVCGLLQVLNPSLISTRYLYYLLKTEAPKHVSPGMGNPKIMAGTMGDIQLEIPSFDRQREIVEILDTFDSLLNDFSTGLPAEITARRQQNEYYRNKLLTFKELKAS